MRTMVTLPSLAAFIRGPPSNPSYPFATPLRKKMDRVWPSGYSYLYALQDGAGGETLAGVPYYYPLAGRTFFAGIEFGL